MRIALAVVLMGASASHADDHVAVAFSRNSVLYPTAGSESQKQSETLKSPFYFRAPISSSGPLIRILGTTSESAFEEGAAIWEIPESGDTWTKLRSVPAKTRAVFVADQAWGYIDLERPRNIVVFDREAKAPLKAPIDSRFVIDDAVPLIWLSDENAVMVSVAQAGAWTQNETGVYENIRPPGEWSIAKLAIDSGKITPITVGQRPALSPDRKTLGFLRHGELWIRSMSNAREQRAYGPRLFAGGVNSLFWLADSSTLMFNIATGSELFGLGSTCCEFDLTTNRVRSLWTGTEGCSAAVRPSFLEESSARQQTQR